MILAGMDTTANSLARVLQLLAENPDIQEKLREEIVTTAEAEGHNGTIDFDRLVELPYLEAICRETLRVYVCSHYILPSADRLVRSQLGC